ncbi:MAG: hypothetical protein ISR34_11315 [Pirellulales bacterium]|nr:hypothetical protein [Pirellulales bacterium]
MTSFYALSFVKRMIIGIFVSLLTLFPFGLNSTASEITDQQMLDVFPPTVAATEKSQRGNTLISLDYTPSTSLWAEGLDERQVFHAQIQHDQNENNSFTLRIGKGGQVYSLRGPFGESVPPSCTGEGPSRSPWNDEVWQFVTVCSKYNGLKAIQQSGDVPISTLEAITAIPYKSTFFIHNSGAYVPDSRTINNLYCPMLAASQTNDKRGYRSLTWGLVPQVRTIHRSPVLYYNQVRDIGNGIIELTWVVHNFSPRDDIVFDFLNAPWGGTRHTSLPYHAISSPDNTLKPRDAFFPDTKPGGTISLRKTGGWKIASASKDEDSASLALVFGRDKHLEEQQAKAERGEPYSQRGGGVLRDFLAHYPQLYNGIWKDWETRPENSFRNYDVIEMIPNLTLRPGESIWYRSFLVVNQRNDAAALAQSLVKDVDYGLLRFSTTDTPRVPVYLVDNRVVETAAAGTQPAVHLFSRPVPGSHPVFLLEDTQTGHEIISTDLYRFVPSEPLALHLSQEHPKSNYYSNARGYSLDKHHCRWKRLLGFGLIAQPNGNGSQLLSTALPKNVFPTPDTTHLDLWSAAIE